MYLHYTKKSPDNEFSVVPILVQLRVLAGFVITILTALTKYENDLTIQALTMIPYIAFTICMVFFFKAYSLQVMVCAWGDTGDRCTILLGLFPSFYHSNRSHIDINIVLVAFYKESL